MYSQVHFVPKEGFIPDAHTAVAVGEAVLTPVYGKDAIFRERPFKAMLHGEVWAVTGGVPCEGPRGVPCPGGSAEVRISKKTRQILSMTHYQ
jgi:hypothetical protein